MKRDVSVGIFSPVSLIFCLSLIVFDVVVNKALGPLRYYRNDLVFRVIVVPEPQQCRRASEAIVWRFQKLIPNVLFPQM